MKLYYENSDYLCHYGVKGMRWGFRKAPNKVSISNTDSAVTKKVKKDYNSMNDTDFKNRYHVSKKTYAKRAEKYGDPYMNSPMAKLGKKLAAKQKRKRDIKKNYEKVVNSSSRRDKLLYSSAYRKKVAKLMTDKNMTLSDASRKVKKEAWRNTAAVMAALTALNVATYAYTNPRY